jgi:hypothetical protein
MGSYKMRQHAHESCPLGSKAPSGKQKHFSFKLKLLGAVLNRKKSKYFRGELI